MYVLAQSYTTYCTPFGRNPRHIVANWNECCEWAHTLRALSLSPLALGFQNNMSTRKPSQ